jgi:hypothetical protein
MSEVPGGGPPRLSRASLVVAGAILVAFAGVNAWLSQGGPVRIGARVFDYSAGWPVERQSWGADPREGAEAGPTSDGGSTRLSNAMLGLSLGALGFFLVEAGIAAVGVFRRRRISGTGPRPPGSTGGPSR